MKAASVIALVAVSAAAVAQDGGAPDDKYQLRDRKEVVSTPVATVDGEREIAPGKMLSADGGTVWWDAKTFLKLEGQAWKDVKRPYDRLPASAAEKIGGKNPGVWNQCYHTSGECFRFTTTARNFKFRWSLVSPALALGHMPSSGVSGIDMYIWKKGEGVWIPRCIGVPSRQDGNVANAFCYPGNPIMLYLPLYNGIKKLEIGVGPGDTIRPLDTPRASGVQKPVVFYGTSITHGGVASRPGMSFPAIVARWLDVPLVNLGFSGSGKMEMEMCEYCAEIDASCYVLDCVWNMTPDMIRERYEPFVRTLRKLRPGVPIVLAEDAQVHLPGSSSGKGKMVKEIYSRLKAEDPKLWKDLYFVPNSALHCADHEGTVDGTHPNDWGMMHLARGFAPVVAEALALKWDGAPASWGAAAVRPAAASSAAAPGRHVIVRDFRTVKDGECVNFNIGTAAHGPSTVSQLLRFVPDAKVTVWADAPLSAEMAGMMKRRFPDVPVVWGAYGPGASPELKAAVESADAMLIGSSSGLFGKVLSSARDFRRATGRTVGCAAMGTPNPAYREFDFSWFRDELALSEAERLGDVAPVRGYAPDSVFYFDCVDEAGAERFLNENALERGKFVCAIPGNRVTPRWEFWGGAPDEKAVAANARFEECDNAVLRAAIVEVVRRHGLKVLVCPEQRTEVALGKRAVMDKLPADVRASCAWTGEYWSPDLALAVYRASRLVFGIEMHSQVMAMGSGVPAVILVHPNFGTKQDMWRTIGCDGWRIDITKAGAGELAARTVSAILSDPEAARAKVEAVRAFLDEKSSAMFASSFARRDFKASGRGGAECPVGNFRDIGGAAGTGGRRVRTGRIYRSAAFDGISGEAKDSFLAATHMKTDVDLRYAAELGGRTSSPLGIAWTNVPAFMYEGMAKPHGKAAFAKVLDLALHEENYPMVIHCRGGRDRTGSIVFALNALLGVSEDDLYADWCKTDGLDPALRPRSAAFERLAGAFSGYGSGTLRERVGAYAIDAGGGRFTDADLRRFAALMLEDGGK